MRISRIFALVLLVAGAVISWTQEKDKRTGQNTTAAPAQTTVPNNNANNTSKAAEEVFKNIQSLKGAPADEVLPAMQYFAVSLGVQCNFCHVVQPGVGLVPEKDDKDEKKTARQMIAMTQAINKDNFKGNVEVGCATCHSGHSNPSAVPPVGEQQAANRPPQRPAQPQPGQPNQPAENQPQAKPQLPSVEQIASNFETAIGGKPAIEKLTTMVEKGTASTPEGDAQFEIDQKAPVEYRLTATFANGRKLEQATNGTTGWRTAERGAQDLSGIQLRSLIANARFNRNLMPTAGFARARVTGSETIDGRDCYVVRGTLADDHFSERLYFDKQSNLLVRRIAYQRTLFGPLPTMYDFSDYRDVQGVKLPFAVKNTQANGATLNFKIDKLEFNVPMDDSKFAKPASQPAASGQ